MRNQNKVVECEHKRLYFTDSIGMVHYEDVFFYNKHGEDFDKALIEEVQRLKDEYQYGRQRKWENS